MEIFSNNIIDSIRFHSVPVQMVETTKTPTDKNNNRNKFWNVVVFVSCLSMGMLACSLHSNANTRGYVSVSLMVLFVFIQLVMKRMFFTCQPLFMIIVCSLTIFIEFFPFPSSASCLEPTCSTSALTIFLSRTRQAHFVVKNDDDDFTTINSNFESNNPDIYKSFRFRLMFTIGLMWNMRNSFCLYYIFRLICIHKRCNT